MEGPFSAGSLVVIYLHSPREKVWGLLCDLNAAGVTLRGFDLRAFDDWLRGLVAADGEAIPASLCFYPLNRVEKIHLDEAGDELGFDARCIARTGRSARVFLEAKVRAEKAAQD